MQLVPVITGAIIFLSIPIAAQSDLSYTDYEKQLAEQRSHDQKYREQIAQEQALIIDYRKKITESRKNIAALHKKKLEMLGITESDVVAAEKASNDCEEKLTYLQSLTSEKLYTSADSVEALRVLWQNLQKQQSFRLPKLRQKLTLMENGINELDLKINAYKGEMQKINERVSVKEETTPQTAPVSAGTDVTTYTVSKSENNPETLFNIARKVYGDPLRWPDIYEANKKVINRNFKAFDTKKKNSSIANPSDLILPGQELTIPR